ncbi:MAG: hypothetical protein IT314_17085 [Anaerolineales bacterium]|nr:hypothetical protein [Anaerolineales bacterium]
MEIIGAIIGGGIAWAISIPIFGTKGGRMIRPGIWEYDPARGDVPPGGCLKSLGNLIFIAVGVVIGYFIGATL